MEPWYCALTFQQCPYAVSFLHFFSHPHQGTKKHPQLALEQQVESMGAHLSAYTSREHTAYYMKTLANDLPKGKMMSTYCTTK